MIRLFAALLLTSWLGAGAAARACEKHIHGHQTGSDTGAEVQRQ
ncbi:MAG: hypothetical protein VKJ66_05205 [Synechococcus sp.]|nr:hypothetical protein [Synechococcus sp.]